MIVDMFFKLEPNVASYTVPAELIRISDPPDKSNDTEHQKVEIYSCPKKANFYDADILRKLVKVLAPQVVLL